MTQLGLDHFVTARAGFRRRLTEQRAERLGRPITGHEFDDHGMHIDVEDPPTPPVAFHLIYSDAKSQLSGRCLTLWNAREEVADVRLTGLCHMRGLRRVFMASRIVEVTDLATGEVHDDALGFFRSHPLVRPITAERLADMSPELLALQECRDEIIVLSFVGAADGNFDDDEQDVIVRHVMDRADELLDEAVVRRGVQSWVPDERSFERALSRLCAGEGDAVALMRSMRKVIDADGEVDPEEVAFAEEVRTRFLQAGVS